MFLFKTYGFNEGIEFISKEKNNYEDILFIIFKNKEYNKLSNIFNRNSNKNKLIWEVGLDLFLEEFLDIFLFGFKSLLGKFFCWGKIV